MLIFKILIFKILHISKYLRAIFNWIQYKCDLKLRIWGSKSDNKKAQKGCFLRCNLIGDMFWVLTASTMENNSTVVIFHCSTIQEIECVRWKQNDPKSVSPLCKRKRALEKSYSIERCTKHEFHSKKSNVCGLKKGQEKNECWRSTNNYAIVWISSAIAGQRYRFPNFLHISAAIFNLQFPSALQIT